LGIESQEDWVLHEAPAYEAVAKYNSTGIGGPNPDDLRVDMRGKISSKWNEAVTNLLLERVREQKGDTAWNELPERSDMYILELVIAQLERARTEWRNALPKIKEDGGMEGRDEVEQRMNEEKEERGTMVRASTRRRAVSPVIPVFRR
jgi:hypothetical protein